MIWALLPDWIVTALAAGATGLIALFVGRWTGKRQGVSEGQKQARIDALERNADAAKRAKGVRNEMESSDDQRLVDILSGVQRDGKR
jgi:hypothetical protein